MNLYENCVFSNLENGGLLLEDVLTSCGLADLVYLGPGGVYVVLLESNEPATMYECFRNLLGITRVQLYFVGKGEYIPTSASFGGEFDLEELDEVIDEYIYRTPQQYTQTMLERMRIALIKADAKERGCYTDEKGIMYIYRHGEFRRATEANPEQVFNLCLYGGCFGLHRFALGKWFSGFIYFFTCGLFMVGWFFDLIQMFLGSQKDKHKYLLCPLQERTRKLCFLPVGIAINSVALFVWFHLIASPERFLMFLS